MMARIPAALALFLLAACAHVARTPPAARDMLAYIGTYTGEHSQGIYVSRFDPRSGALGPPELAAESTNPSFLAVHPSDGFLYAVNEIGQFEGKPAGSVSAFAIDRSTGRLTLINRQPSGGPGPAHLVVDAPGRHVLVANYGGGSAAVLPIDGSGALQPPSSVVQHKGSSVNPDRQKQPHAHAVQLDPDNRFAYVPDLGIDRVMIYRFDGERGVLEPHEPPSAPVAAGAGRATSRSTRGAARVRDQRAHVHDHHVQPGVDAGRAHRRPHGVDAAGRRGGAEGLQHGRDPRAPVGTLRVRIQPRPRHDCRLLARRGHRTADARPPRAHAGQHAAQLQHRSVRPVAPRRQQRSNSVVVFRIDTETGRLTPAGHTIDVGSPVAISFVSP
jgi:6-phosphogluconolactonase